MRRKGLEAGIAILLIALIVGCSKGDGGSAGEASGTEPAWQETAQTSPSAQPSSSQAPMESPSQTPQSSSTGEELRTLKFRLDTVAASGSFDRPLGFVARTGQPSQFYIVEQEGKIRLLDSNRPKDKPALVIDLTDRVNDNGNEKGLLGLALHPKRTGEVYVNYTTATHTVISRISADKSNPNRLDPGSEEVLLTFKQPRSNHNGGQLAFGPDGMLYIAAGDGGGSGDPDGNGQNKNTLLGKILRIDVDRKDGDRAYAIPAGNPFISGGGAPEIYAYGLRNPWRFSFDVKTGQLWAADVGQNKLEEINIITAGGNYGWNVREGTACYKPAKGCASEGLIPPIFEYGRDKGVSITGGYVYRGEQIPALTGWYVYADYATGTIWGLRQLPDGKVDNRTLLESRTQITSFGTDDKGEIYVVAQDGGIYRLAAARN